MSEIYNPNEPNEPKVIATAETTGKDEIFIYNKYDDGRVTRTAISTKGEGSGLETTVENPENLFPLVDDIWIPVEGE